MKLSQLLVAILVALAGLGFTPIQKTIAAPLGASIKVIVEDQYGNPAPEERVTLTGSLGNVYIGTTNVGYTIVGVIADDYVVEVHGVTGTVRAVENITQTIRIKVTYPLPGEKWFQARHFGTSLGFWLHQDILFSYRWKCYLYENGAQLNMDTSCGTYWGPIMIGFSIGEHKVMLHAITPDRMNTVYMTQTFQVYLDPATIVPTSTPVPVMSPTPNFWETPTATPSMLTIRAWLPYSIR